MTIKYGLAEFDRGSGLMDWSRSLPMEGVEPGSLPGFLQSAGANGWELCASFPGADDRGEIITFLFKSTEQAL